MDLGNSRFTSVFGILHLHITRAHDPSRVPSRFLAFLTNEQYIPHPTIAVVEQQTFMTIFQI